MPDLDAGETTGPFDITVDGQVGDQVIAGRSGELYLAGGFTPDDGSDPNPIDVCVRVGSPAVDPGGGAIWFATNTGCLPSVREGLFVDMADVSVDGVTILVEPHERGSATALNVFSYVSDANTLGDYHLIENGRITIEAIEDGYVGTIDVGGSCAACSDPVEGAARRYEATFSG